MAYFDAAYALTMNNEGGYANSKADTGGQTYMGISRVYNPHWLGWPVVDTVVAKAKSTDEINHQLGGNDQLQRNVQAFYKTNYWSVNSLDQIASEKLAQKLFDIGVNMGVTTAARMLQEALNLTNVNERLYKDTDVDGQVGGETLRLTNAHPKPAILYRVIQGLQAERYIKLLRAKPGQEVFAGSWFSRI